MYINLIQNQTGDINLDDISEDRVVSQKKIRKKK
jgi:hypothetical protein